MPEVYVSVGSNVRRRSSIKVGLRALYRRYGKLSLSKIYETKAVGFTGRPFYNFVVAFYSEDEPEQIIAFMKDVERQCGRRKRDKGNHPRTLDMDLLLYSDLQIDRKNLQLPRDEIFKYAFVLQPLAELAPELRCPGKRTTFARLWSQFVKEKQPEQARLIDWQPLPDIFRSDRG